MCLNLHRNILLIKHPLWLTQKYQLVCWGWRNSLKIPPPFLRYQMAGQHENITIKKIISRSTEISQIPWSSNPLWAFSHWSSANWSLCISKWALQSGYKSVGKVVIWYKSVVTAVKKKKKDMQHWHKLQLLILWFSLQFSKLCFIIILHVAGSMWKISISL